MARTTKESPFESIDSLLEHELNDLYDAESQLIEAIPKMAQGASSPELKQSFRNHLQETKQQKQRLEKIFKQLGKRPKPEKCDGMAGLIKEGSKVLKSKGNPQIKDAALIGAAQRVEHYEIAAYGTIREFARLAGQDEIAQMVEDTLKEEAHTDKLLTSLAVEDVNVQAREAA